ncbi:MAG TPA: EamA family transporter [Gammaproteobacteria bacterium]|nr:EamA family transporter [Gammaproteobacteria bacterium]
MTTDRKLYRQGILLLVGSALFLSTSGIALRSIEQANGWQILFYRSVALSITVFLFLAYQKRSAVLDEFRGLGWNDAMLAVFLGTGMVAYVFALLYITVANALFILSSTPFVAGILGWIVLRERVAARTWFAIAVSIVGLVIMVGSGIASGHFLGNLIAMYIPISYAAVIVVVRRSKRESMLGALCLAGLVAGTLSAIFITDYGLTPRDLGISIYLGVFQVGVGFTLMVLGTRYVPAAQVGLLSLVEPVLAPLWVWLGVGEIPTVATLVGGAIIFLAIGLNSTFNILKPQDSSR